MSIVLKFLHDIFFSFSFFQSTLQSKYVLGLLELQEVPSIHD